MDQLSREEFIYGILLHLGALVTVAMISRLAKNFQDYFLNVISQKAGMQLYQRSLRQIFALPYKVFEDQKSGQLLQKLHQARTNFQTFLRLLIDVVFLSFVGLSFVIIYAYVVHRLIGLLYTLLVPIMAFTMYIMSRKIKISQSRIVKESSDLAGETTETVRNVSLIKSLWLQEQEMDRLEDTNVRILWLELEKIKLIRLLEFTQGTLINAMRVGIMWVMLWLVFTEVISLWQFMTLFFYSFFIFGPLWQLSYVVQAYQEAKASDDLLQELASLPTEKESPNAHIVDDIWSITFTDVSFSYTKQELVLSNINFSLSPGDTIAFVGPSWAGKSTIMKLLVGLYSPSSWEVLVNDIPLTTIAKKPYQQRIGLVAQDAQLFGGSIRQNLLFVKPDATEEEMMEVLEQASILDLVTEQKEWLDAKIGEWWIKISGGQKQRLSIARALLRRPDLLIFDEATSSLDSLIEQEITTTVNAITRQYSHLMTVLVAHRLSTVMHADRIYVLEKWRVVEHWTHAVLLEQKWLYYALWRQQVGEDS